MSEAISGIIDWASHQQEIKKIVASCDKENFASYKVLEKNHFTRKDIKDPILFHFELLIPSIDHL
jgi:RimJ/RimL family protein N-acetyltransferase